ncbi:hypothetical protein TNCV_2578391 [Trichonephila clavipes]|nr:hypothetical protein TNCV_2578391 [Trichonephila clavipes]
MRPSVKFPTINRSSDWVETQVLQCLGGHGSRVVKVSDRGRPFPEFEPNTTKDPPCRGTIHLPFLDAHGQCFKGD